MKMFDEKFLLISAIPEGCFVCDPFYEPKAQIFDSLEELVNHFYDMMEGKVDHTYPVELKQLSYCGEIWDDEEDEMYLSWDSGCLSRGLKGVEFVYNGLKYKLKRGRRVVDENV